MASAVLSEAINRTGYKIAMPNEDYSRATLGRPAQDNSQLR